MKKKKILNKNTGGMCICHKSWCMRMTEFPYYLGLFLSLTLVFTSSSCNQFCLVFVSCLTSQYP